MGFESGTSVFMSARCSDRVCSKQVSEDKPDQKEGNKEILRIIFAL